MNILNEAIMKRIFSVLICVSILCAMFVMPSNATSELINKSVDIPFVENAPVVDGVVSFNEYGSYSPIHSFARNSAQFTDDGNHNRLNNIDDIQFYISWTEDNLYMAWIVDTDVHTPFPKGTYEMEGDYAKMVYEDWPQTYEEQVATLKYMWYFSCIQFIITPGAPQAGTTNYQNDKNFLSIGLCEMDDGTIGKATWNVPNGAYIEEYAAFYLDAAIVRNDTIGATTYEIAIPAEFCGVSSFSNNTTLGLGYAVSAQEHYWENGSSMLEWQDSMLSWPGKADNAGVIKLTGNENIGPDDSSEPEDVYAEGDISQLTDPNFGDAIDAESIIFVDDINKVVSNDKVSIMTRMDISYNNYGNNIAAVLLAPSQEDCYLDYTKYFTVLGKGEGFADALAFYDNDGNPVYTDIQDNCIIIVVDDTNPGYEAIKNYNAGDTVGLWGFYFNASTVPTRKFYGNAAVYTYDYGDYNPDYPDYSDPDYPDDSSMPADDSSVPDYDSSMPTDDSYPNNDSSSPNDVTEAPGEQRPNDSETSSTNSDIPEYESSFDDSDDVDDDDDDDDDRGGNYKLKKQAEKVTTIGIIIAIVIAGLFVILIPVIIVLIIVVNKKNK